MNIDNIANKEITINIKTVHYPNIKYTTSLDELNKRMTIHQCGAFPDIFKYYIILSEGDLNTPRANIYEICQEEFDELYWFLQDPLKSHKIPTPIISMPNYSRPIINAIMELEV